MGWWSGHGGPGGSGTPGGPGVPGAAGAPVAAWQAPTDVERALYEAKAREDWPGYFDVLGSTWLYWSTPRHPLDAVGQTSFGSYWNPGTRTRCVALFTAGMLPPPVPDPVFVSRHLGSLARIWPDDEWWLAVNPGTPCEAYFPAGMAHRAVWRQHWERAWRPRHSTLRTLWTGGPLHGPVAHGLACGALMSVKNGSYWNSVAWHGTGYDDEVYLLKRWWGVTTREKWLTYLEELLRGDMVSGAWEFVLKVRDTLARASRTDTVSVAKWRDVTEHLARERLAETLASRDGPPDTSVMDEIKRLQGLIGKIMRYEARFRADGLLPEDGYVRSVLAWDHGRASGMARWGLGARFGELWETEQALLRAGRVSQASYDSWEEFSRGYVLGRCLHFDDEEFGDWYTEMLDAHRILTTDPASPWLNLPFK
ncbi:DUF1266 domain-containing protein [Streptomyces daliensis]|uniref:DUF1266 domain-containing protein n=1 Tax=Streptomyces daliensis TaxID=299421 RepID=A0A8T4J8B3_9ACTN|nr:DUF1266 domain-containing protein [Streptomyces daliensis]